MDKDKQRLYIYIERWQSLINMLDDKRKVWRLAMIFVVIGVTLFLGISLVAIMLKKSYTYSDITTNALGATQIKDEQKEVSYFLFNTAELWANSGIKVHQGDVISVHSSGRANTAIHHQYENAKKNLEATDEFFDANGERVRPESVSERLRSEYRIFPRLPQSALVMQVCDNTNLPLVPRDGNPNNFYYIGAHCENIHINADGMLYFAINDIVLDSLTIIQMMVDNMRCIMRAESSLHANLPEPQQINRMNMNQYHKVVDSITNTWSSVPAYRSAYIRGLKNSNTFKLGGYEQHDIDTTTTPIRTELDYYLEHAYERPWYDDNIGSFLIVVERNYHE